MKNVKQTMSVCAATATYYFRSLLFAIFAIHPVGGGCVGCGSVVAVGRSPVLLPCAQVLLLLPTFRHNIIHTPKPQAADMRT